MNIDRSSSIANTIKQYAHREEKWKELKTVAVVSGLAGCGKTSLLLDYFKDKRYFYFSFAGLAESVAEKLFADKLSMATDKAVIEWDEAFKALSMKYKFVIFDDLTPIASYKRFKDSFYENMCRGFNLRPLVFLIAQSNDDLDGLADSFHEITVNYFSVPEVIKLFSSLSKFDILGLCSVSGGIPKIMKEYDEQKTLEENLLAFLAPSSAFTELVPYFMDRYFRKPEIYHHILYAIAKGNYRISEIGKFTGYAYNKCDNYVSVLVATGIVKIEKEKSKHGTEKTTYVFANAYFRLWYLYVYANRSDIVMGNNNALESIVKDIIEKEIHAFHVQRSFAYINNKIKESNFWATFRIAKKITYSPQTVSKDNFSYTFDAIYRNSEKAVFVKVFADPLENCKKDELAKIEKAVTLANKYYDSHVFLFTKRRFSDYAAKRAPSDDMVSFVEIERLKY